MGPGEKIRKMEEKGKNKAKGRRNPLKMSLLAGAKLIFSGRGGGLEIIYIIYISV